MFWKSFILKKHFLTISDLFIANDQRFFSRGFGGIDGFYSRFSFILFFTFSGYLREKGGLWQLIPRGVNIHHFNKSSFRSCCWTAKSFLLLVRSGQSGFDRFNPKRPFWLPCGSRGASGLRKVQSAQRSLWRVEQSRWNCFRFGMLWLLRAVQ